MEYKNKKTQNNKREKSMLRKLRKRTVNKKVKNFKNSVKIVLLIQKLISIVRPNIRIKDNKWQIILD